MDKYPTGSLDAARRIVEEELTFSHEQTDEIDKAAVEIYKARLIADAVDRLTSRLDEILHVVVKEN